MQFKALYNGYIFNSINELASFIGFRAILDCSWKNLKNIVIFYKYFQIFFLVFSQIIQYSSKTNKDSKIINRVEYIAIIKSFKLHIKSTRWDY